MQNNLFNQADYITDQQGNIKSVILDYQTYRKIQEILMDYGLGKAMEEALDDEEVDLDNAMKLTGYNK